MSAGTPQLRLDSADECRGRLCSMKGKRRTSRFEPQQIESAPRKGALAERLPLRPNLSAAASARERRVTSLISRAQTSTPRNTAIALGPPLRPTALDAAASTSEPPRGAPTSRAQASLSRNTVVASGSPLRPKPSAAAVSCFANFRSCLGLLAPRQKRPADVGIKL